MLDKGIVEQLRIARNEVEAIATQLNDQVEGVLKLLIGLADPEWAQAWLDGEAEDLWWWFGVDDDRPFRRGDRHGYLRTDDGEFITVYLDEPSISLPGFDQYVYNTPRSFSETKRIPAKYLSMTDEDIIIDATLIMAKASQQDQAKDQAQTDAKNVALSKLTEEEKKALGY